MKHKIKTLYLAGFLFSIPIALTSYINSSFLSLFVEEKVVGIIFTAGSIVSIFALLIAPKVWRKLGGYRFVLFLTILDILSLFLLSVAKTPSSVIPVFILHFAINILMIFSLDELLKIFSENSATGKIRGIYLTVCNLAWIAAQVMSGSFLGSFSFGVIYSLSFVIMILFLLIFISTFKSLPDPNYDKENAAGYIKRFLKNKKLFRAYGINFLLQFFYCLMIIYTPIYLSLYLGFSWKEIGIIFALMLLPFSFIPFRMGEYGDKFGERKMLMFGFAISSFATILLFFIHMRAVWIWALLLFTTRIGAATIEVMSDAYFFKHITPENEEYISVYRNAVPAAYILGPIVAFATFSFVPSFNFIFIVLGVVMLYGVYLSSTIRKNDI